MVGCAAAVVKRDGEWAFRPTKGDDVVEGYVHRVVVLWL